MPDHRQAACRPQAQAIPLAAPAPVESRLGDRDWRLNHLYRIADKAGLDVPFEMNWAQRRLFERMWYFNVVLKARQLGVSSFVLLFMLDACLFNSNVRAGVLAATREDGERLLAEKVRYAWRRLPEPLRAAVPLAVDRVDELGFANGSSIRAVGNLRGGTLQYLLITEFGRLSAHFPAKAAEVRAGALNAVQAGQFIFVESTAEGREGAFYDLCQQAQKLDRQGPGGAGGVLTALDPRFHFFPWWRHPDYRLEGAEASAIEPGEARYFEQVEKLTGARFSAPQRAWYVHKKRQQGERMRAEFPSTPEEAFEQAIEGAYFAAEMVRARRDGRLCRVPVEPMLPVSSFWDLGVDDHTAIWLHQRLGREDRFVGYYENAGEGLAHYAAWLRQWQAEKGAVFETHYLPHDVEVTSLSTGQSRRRTLEGLGVRPIRTVARTRSVADDIQATRNALARCWFDETACGEGIRRLEEYRREWNAARGVWADRPRHDAASHGADAFRAFAVGYRPAAGPGQGAPAGRAVDGYAILEHGRAVGSSW